MSRLLRADLDELDAYVTRIAKASGIPSSHIEKDYWVTEVLRGAATASRETGLAITESNADDPRRGEAGVVCCPSS